MGAVLNPYVSFRGQAREAMEFYQSVLGGQLNVMTFGDAHMEGADPDGVMHSQLETPAGFTLMASDAPEGMEHTVGDNVGISISGTDEVLRDYFRGLSEGGTVTLPMEKQMWGDEFGMFTDRFGVNWMVNLAGQA